VLGDFDAALARVRDIDKLPATEYQREQTRALEAAIVLRTARLDPPSSWSEETFVPGAGVRRGEPLDKRDVILQEECTVGLENVVASAQHGDGTPLARLLRRCQVIDFSSWLVFALLPRITSGRAELADALRWQTDTSFDNDLPFSAMAAAGTKRDLLRLAGADGEADDWQAIVDRHAAVLQNRDRLVALVLWDWR